MLKKVKRFFHRKKKKKNQKEWTGVNYNTRLGCLSWVRNSPRPSFTLGSPTHYINQACPSIASEAVQSSTCFYAPQLFKYERPEFMLKWLSKIVPKKKKKKGFPRLPDNWVKLDSHYITLGQNGHLPLSSKICNRILLFWNYLIKCPCFKTQFLENQVLM